MLTCHCGQPVALVNVAVYFVASTVTKLLKAAHGGLRVGLVNPVTASLNWKVIVAVPSPPKLYAFDVIVTVGAAVSSV